MAGEHVLQGGGVHGKGVCMARGCAWQGGVHGMGGMCGRGGVHGVRAYVAGGGACMTGGMHGRGDMHDRVGVCGRHACHSRYYGIRSMSGRYASYWNAF